MDKPEKTHSGGDPRRAVISRVLKQTRSDASKQATGTPKQRDIYIWMAVFDKARELDNVG